MFVLDPESGAHTQNIENIWWQIKRTLPATQSQHDGGLLLMFGVFVWTLISSQRASMHYFFAAVCLTLLCGY